jgi:septal ring factor EnvC (AmiA/AmiB activator)
MFATIIGWLAGPTIKYWAIGIGALVGIVALASVYFSFVNLVQSKARLEAENAQKEQIINEQNETINHQKALMKLQSDYTIKLQDDLKKLDEEADSIDDAISKPEIMKSDRESSAILKETIKRLK